MIGPDGESLYTTSFNFNFTFNPASPLHQRP